MAETYISSFLDAAPQIAESTSSHKKPIVKFGFLWVLLALETFEQGFLDASLLLRVQLLPV